MIEIRDLEKSFGEIRALQHISLTIRDGELFGVVGTNGAGKSTLLRILAGVLRQEKGTVLVDGEPFLKTRRSKAGFVSCRMICGFSTTPPLRTWKICIRTSTRPSTEKNSGSFVPGSAWTARESSGRSPKACRNRPPIFLGICANTEYLLCDETFDGLDPLVRQEVKSMLAVELLNRQFTPIAASHNLRELEDICDHVGLLHRGGMLLSENLRK